MYLKMLTSSPFQLKVQSQCRNAPRNTAKTKFKELFEVKYEVQLENLDADAGSSKSSDSTSPIRSLSFLSSSHKVRLWVSLAWIFSLEFPSVLVTPLRLR